MIFSLVLLPIKVIIVGCRYWKREVFDQDVSSFHTFYSACVMKKPAFSSVLILLFSAPLFAQTSEADFPSMGAMFSSFTSTEGGKEVSLSEDIDTIVKSLSDQPKVKNTEESVQTAITGPLVVEEATPDTNREIVESIDRKTNRYAPRIKLDFESFPLVRRSSAEMPLPAERVAQHLQRRLRLEQPIAVEFHERTVSLRGSVGTERQKELAAIILSFEPGVDDVRNELIVAQ